MKIKYFIEKYLGKNFEQDLIKSEVGPILKPDANVSIFPHEIYIALQIVPRTVISLLVQHLKPLPIGGIADIPWATEDGIHTIHVNKISRDLYSGKIHGKGKILATFNYRSLPAVGLFIMSTYELYDKDTNKQDVAHPEFDYNKVQNLIDERIRMQMMIEDVVGKKISEREALQSLINQKINDYLRTSDEIKNSLIEQPSAIKQSELEDEDQKEEAEESEDQETEDTQDEVSVKDIDVDEELLSNNSSKQNKKNKLKEFLNRKNTKKSEKVFFTKKEISCPYCDKKLYNGDDAINLCICYGEAFGQDFKITKSDTGYSFKYPKNFSIENAQMLLAAIKKN